MTAAVSLTQTQLFTALVAALRTFGLVDAAGAAIPIIRGQVNRVPEPAAADFVVLWPIARDRLATNRDTWTDAVQAAMQETEITIQADVHGPASADNAARITTLFRDQAGVDAFAAQGVALAPLYTSDPRQMPFENEAQQTEERWVIDLHLQADVTITTAAQTANELSATAEAVEAAYPA